MSKGFSLVKVPRLSNARVGQPYGKLFNYGIKCFVSLQPGSDGFVTVHPKSQVGPSIGITDLDIG